MNRKIDVVITSAFLLVGDSSGCWVRKWPCVAAGSPSLRRQWLEKAHKTEASITWLKFRRATMLSMANSQCAAARRER